MVTHFDKYQDRYETRKLTADERPREKYYYWVSGAGDFPFDMLRYDQCWPVTSEDAYKIHTHNFVADREEVRSINLASFDRPTVERWASFLWSVGTIKLD